MRPGELQYLPGNYAPVNAWQGPQQDPLDGKKRQWTKSLALAGRF